MSTEFFFYHHAAKDRMDNQCKDCVKARRRKRYRPIIYKITNTINGKVYIGQTIKPITERVSKHFSDAKRGRKQPLYIDIIKLDFNRDLFTFSVLEVTLDEMLDDREKFWISYYQEAGVVLYNIELGGQKGMVVPRSTRLMQAKSRGTRPFTVYDSHKNSLGDFEIISEANKVFGTHELNKVLSGEIYHCKGYTAFYKDEFTYEKLDFNISKYTNLDKPNSIFRDNTNYKGSKNGMYGRYGKDSPTAKEVYVFDNNLKFITKTDTCKDAKEKYSLSTINCYANGDYGHYCKKLNLNFYYKDYLPKEVSYN